MELREAYADDDTYGMRQPLKKLSIDHFWLDHGTKHFCCCNTEISVGHTLPHIIIIELCPQEEFPR